MAEDDGAATQRKLDPPAGSASSGRSGRDALVAVVTAIVTAAISSFTTYTVQKRSADEQAAVERAKLEAAKQERDQAFTAERQKLMVDHVEQEKDTQRRLVKELQGKYYEVRMINQWPATVRVAVRYTDLNDKIIVHGWSYILPGQTATVLYTQSREFWLFADTGGGDRPCSWQGNGDRLVSSYNFDYLEDNYLTLGNYLPLPTQAVKFRQIIINLPSTAGVYQLPLTCASG